MRRAAAMVIGMLLTAAAPARAAGEMALEVVGRVSQGAQEAKDSLKLSVSTRPGADFSARGSVKMGGAQRAGEVTLSFQGTRGEGDDRATISIDGEYDVFFGVGEQGVEISGAFKGAVDLAPGEERVLSEMEVAGQGPRQPPTRIQIVVRARR